MSLAAYLAESRPMRVDGTTLTVGLPGSSLHEEVLNAMENRRLIEPLLSELCKRQVSVHYESLPEPAPTTATERSETTPPIVQDIVNLFDATVQKARPT